MAGRSQKGRVGNFSAENPEVTLGPDCGPWEKSQVHEAGEQPDEETTLNEVGTWSPVSENKEAPLPPC